MVPQELLIIKSEIPPDSAESILLSYLISIFFYLSCFQLASPSSLEVKDLAYHPNKLAPKPEAN